MVTAASINWMPLTSTGEVSAISIRVMSLRSEAASRAAFSRGNRTDGQKARHRNALDLLHRKSILLFPTTWRKKSKQNNKIFARCFKSDLSVDKPNFYTSIQMLDFLSSSASRRSPTPAATSRLPAAPLQRLKASSFGLSKQPKNGRLPRIMGCYACLPVITRAEIFREKTSSRNASPVRF